MCNEEEALKKKEQQKALYNSIMANLSEVEKNIEEAAVQELEEVIQDYNEETFGKRLEKTRLRVCLLPVAGKKSWSP